MLKETLNKSIALSLKTDHHFIPGENTESIVVNSSKLCELNRNDNVSLVNTALV